MATTGWHGLCILLGMSNTLITEIDGYKAYEIKTEKKTHFNQAVIHENQYDLKIVDSNGKRVRTIYDVKKDDIGLRAEMAIMKLIEHNPTN
jgi:hypothetical protein